MSRKKKQEVKESPQLFRGEALADSKLFADNDYWLAHTVLEKDKFYSKEEAVALIEKVKKERVI